MKNGVPIFLIIVSAGLSYFYVMPQYESVKELRRESKEYDDLLTKALELREIRQELSKRLNQIPPEDLDKLQKMLPEKVDLSQLVLDIDNLALSEGIIIRDIDTDDLSEGSSASRRSGSSSETQGPYKVVNISFKFESTYANAKTFLDKLESSLRIMDVSSLKVSKNEKNPSRQNYEMVVRTYWLR